jgi:sugar lactone lactonase YvrE
MSIRYLLLAGVLLLLSLRTAPGSAAPLLGPDEALTIDQIRPGMRGIGKSVFEGTRIETFHVTVMGVLRKIDYGGDLVLIRIEDGPVVRRRQGVSQGMSGSPIYIDGKLVGALAFAWPFSKEPIAGVTPIHQMLEDFEPGSSGRPTTSDRPTTNDQRPTTYDLRLASSHSRPLRIDGKPITRVQVVPEAVAGHNAPPQTLMLAPVATPIFVSGMGRMGLDWLNRSLARYNVVAMPGPGRAETNERPELVPGAAVGAQLIAGDVDVTAIGTVTLVKNGRVLAFGHPMFGLGAIDVPMTTAYVHGVLSSANVSFKLASPIEMVGKVSQDRNWAIGGWLGRNAELIPSRFRIRDLERGVSRDYGIRSIQQKGLTSQIIFGSLLSAVASVAPPAEGTTRSTLEVTPRGLPPVRRENLFASGGRSNAFEQLFADPFAGLPMGELLEVLDTLENNPFGPIPVEGIQVDVEVSEKRRSATIERVYADRKRVKPGETVKVGVVIQPYHQEKELRELTVQIPKNTPGGRIQIGVAGGQSARRTLSWLGVQRPAARTVPQLLAAIVERERNNDLVVETTLPVAGINAQGLEFPDLPNSLAELLLTANPTGVRLSRGHQRQVLTMPWSLSGGQILALQVEAEEKDKVGPAPTPSLFPGLFGFGSFFEELYRYNTADAPSGDEGDEPADGMSYLGVSKGKRETVGDKETAFLRSILPRSPIISRSPLLTHRMAANGEPIKPPRMPTWEELDELQTKSVSELSIQDASPGGRGRKGIGRAASVWRQASQKEFAAGKGEGVLITSTGEVVAAPTPERLYDAADRFLIGQVADHRGNVYVGSWLDGTVLRIDAEGRVTTFHQTGDVAVQALAVDRDDNLYVGAIPSGRITRIRPDGTATPLCRLENSYIWAMTCDPAGNLYAATGSEGKLYRVSPDGKAEVLFTAPDRHILALAAGSKLQAPSSKFRSTWSLELGAWSLYFGTYPKGKVYRLDADGGVKAIFEAPKAAVQSLAVDTRGNLYVGTSPKAAVYKIAPDGAVTTLFESTERHVMSLVADPDGMLYAAVGPTGKVYRIAPDKTVASLFDPETAYALSLTRDAAGHLLATTAGPSRVYHVELAAHNPTNDQRPTTNDQRPTTDESTRSQERAEGATSAASTERERSEHRARAIASTFTSTVHDAGGPARWGVIRWRADAKGTPVRLQTRTGNTAYPDATWSDWSPELAASAGTKVPSPPGQFIQYRALLGTPGANPARLQSVEVYYLTRNRAPEVTLSTPARDDVWSGEKSIQWTAKDPDGDRLAFELFAAPEGSTRWKKLGSKTKPPTTVTRKDEGPARAPAGPEALSETEEADDSQSTDFTWNTTEVKDGRYRLKIVASDANANPTEPLTAEAVSEAIVVDNTPPTIELRAARRPSPKAPPQEIPCRDAVSPIASAEYRVDKGEWIAAAAADGIFDSPAESLRLDPNRLPRGRHTLTLRVRDAAGNERMATLTYQR